MASSSASRPPTLLAQLDLLYERRNLLLSAIAHLERYERLGGKPIQEVREVVPIERRKTG
jgi:hypothetical protein